MGVFFAPMSVDYYHIRRFLCLGYLLLKQGFILCLNEDNLGVVGQRKSVGRFGETEIGNFNAVDLVHRDIRHIVAVEVCACCYCIFAFPEINCRNQTFFTAVKRMVGCDIENIKADFQHFLADLDGRIEHRIA